MKSINPHTGRVIEEFKPLSNEELIQKIERSWEAFQSHRKSDINVRKEKFLKLSKVLLENAPKYAEVITSEMGKPYQESIAEVQKAAKHCEYCANNLEMFLAEEHVPTDAKKSFVEYQPIGPVFFIAPFNFPFWLVFKGAAPALAVGNTILSKVASSCPRTGMCVEEAFKLAGFDQGEFQFLLTTQEQSEIIIGHKYVRGVSFTGSTKGGSTIASLAGKYCKKSIMELGGSDPLVVMKDADLDIAVNVAVSSRLRNAGQVCSCAKRFIIDESVYDEFVSKLIEKVKSVKIGDPMKKDTKLGPLAAKRVLEGVQHQLKEGLKAGGKLLYGGEKPDLEELKNGYYFIPAIVEVDEKNPLVQEETFGPIFALLKYRTEEEALRLANNTQYGLGSIVISKDEERALQFGRNIEAGALFINNLTKSDSKMPSGGVKESGYGRECGVHGAREFTNVKTVWVGK
jgi:NAD-dependent aldehyde dehydrogenases